MPIERNYGVTTAALLESAALFSQNFLIHKKEFLATAPALFTPDSAVEFIDWVEAARQTPTDRHNRATHIVETSELHTAITAFHKTVNKLIFYINQLPGGKERNEVIFNTAKRTQKFIQIATTIGFSEEFALAVKTHTPQLQAVGAPAKLIADAVATPAILYHLRDTQGKLKNDRHTATVIRQEQYNAIWALMKNIALTAEQIWDINDPIRTLFKLPQPKKTAKEPIKK